MTSYKNFNIHKKYFQTDMIYCMLEIEIKLSLYVFVKMIDRF